MKNNEAVVLRYVKPIDRKVREVHHETPVEIGIRGDAAGRRGRSRERLVQDVAREERDTIIE